MNAVWRSLILALAVSLALAAIALFVILRWLLPPATQQAPSSRYVIGDWQGQVAVFEGDQAFPRQVFDVYVSTLPAQEQQQVKKGIPVEDEAHLSVLLEDYTG